MRPINSLRFRVAFVFSAFGALLSIFLSCGIYLAAHELGHQLMDETLRAELDDSVERHARNPQFIPPNTVSIKGYVLSSAEPGRHIPAVIKSLMPGIHNVTSNDVDYRVMVADRNGARYFMLFETDGQHEREESFLGYLSAFAVFMTIASAGGGFWLAIRILSPVARLSEQISRAEASDVKLSLSKLTRNDEVGELARAFDHYFHRMRAFIERENSFTTDVSHELRTPLAIIQGAVEVLALDEALSTKQRERVERIGRATQDMIDLSTALLMMAHEPLPAADQQPCDVGKVLQATVKKHHHLIGGRPIRLELELIGEPLLFVEGPLLEVVIGNLLRNALFNTGSGTVRLRLERDRLIVADTGGGIRPEVLAHAFERYYKGTSSDGAGVGLSLVQRICDRYGWRISLTSQEGCGTTAEIDFSATAKVSIV